MLQGTRHAEMIAIDQVLEHHEGNAKEAHFHEWVV
jgi:hypothetical protein